jgi:SNF2 family DNA or RNA helicase
LPNIILKLLKENLKGLNPEVVKKIKDISNQKFEILPRPDGLKAELRSYQQSGYSWLYSIGKRISVDALLMIWVLGKTLQTLALLLKLKSEETYIEQASLSAVQQLTLFDEPKKQKKASLIIVPTSLVYNWHNEVKKFTPQLKVYRHNRYSKEEDCKCQFRC